MGTNRPTFRNINGKKMGFCDTGIGRFCEVNGLDVNGAYTRKELRNIVVQRRAENGRFRGELAAIGIKIGK